MYNISCRPLIIHSRAASEQVFLQAVDWATNIIKPHCYPSPKHPTLVHLVCSFKMEYAFFIKLYKTSISINAFFKVFVTERFHLFEFQILSAHIQIAIKKLNY